MDLGSHAARANRASPSKRHETPRVAILGAGISGLVAAHELSQSGLPVTLFERSGRVGGRIQTFRFPGTEHLGELGAMRIPASHVHTLRYITKMRLDDRLSRFTTMFQGRSGLVAPGSLAGMPGPLLPTQDAGNELAGLVSQILMDKLKVVIDVLSPGEIRDVFHEYASGRLYSDLSTLLRTKVDPARFGFLLHAPLEEVVRLLQGLEEQMAPSLRLFFRDISWEVSADLFLLRGGLQQLPERLAASLPHAVNFHSEIQRIFSHESFVELVIRDLESGTSRLERFDYVICTLPVPVLRKVLLEGFTHGKLEALRKARYASASKVLFLCKEKFWRRPPHDIRSGGTFAGNTSRQLYYNDIDLDEGSTGSGRGTLLASYTLGRDSEALAGLPDDEVVSLVREDIGRIHPEINEPGMVEAFKVRHWQKEEGFLGGCSVTWPIYYEDASPGDNVTRVWNEVARPDKRVYFAGEHCSDHRAWMEGAVTSSLKTVSALLRDSQEAGATAGAP
jgi:monoamine oxidase